MVPSNIALSLLAACLIAQPALGARGLSQDRAFLAARDAFRVGDAVKRAKHAARLKGYILEPYVEYWLLKTRLEQTPADEVRGVLERHANTLIAEALRRDWLHVVGKKEQWELFEQELPLLANGDAEVRCYSLLARWRQSDDSALAQLKPFWYAPRELPEGCVPIAQDALKSGQLGAGHVWARFRVLTDANQIGPAKRVLSFLPRQDAPDSRQVDAAASSPTRFLDRLPELRGRAAKELTILALSRLARSDPQFAAAYWDRKLRGRFSDEDRAYVWAQIATQGAKRHLAEAVGWFAESGDAPLTDEQAEWRARIALRQQDWVEVRGAIERMSPLARGEPAWTYWLGRASRALGQTGQSNAALARIAGAPNFYGQLASEELGLRIEVPPRPAPPTREELAEVAANGGLQRALALYRLNMRVEATREWNWTIRAMDDRTLLAAAELARSNEVWDRAINTADRTVVLHDFALRYLAPYHDVLAEQARSRELEEHWVLGLVRQESRFIANAKSSAGASGLMQLMPATARWIAKKVGLRDYSWSRVTEVSINAALGTAYLKQVLDDLDGSPVLAAAAYNAGPGRARKWRDTRPLEGAIYAESIPFNETRDYVKKVMANTVYYSEVLGGTKRTLKERLGVIAPRSPADRMAAIRDGSPQ